MSLVCAWSGAVTDSGANVRTKIHGGQHRLLVADNPGMSGGVFVNGTATTDTVWSTDVPGLDPDTRYYYRAEDDGVVDTTMTGQFRTPGVLGEPYSFRFGAASCSGHLSSYDATTGMAPHRVSNHPVFDTIRSMDPNLWIHLGDLHYYNAGDGVAVPDASVNTYRDGFETVLRTTRQGRLYREVATAYVWDDHDYAYNNTDGTFPDKTNAAQAYREWVPHYPLPEPSGPIYQGFQIGRVQFALLDSRYNRDAPDAPAPRTYLGSAQVSWLDNLLATSTAEVLVVASPQPMNSGGSTSWGSYLEERDQLYQMFGDHGWGGRMCVISGDQHQLAMDTGANNGGFPLFVCAALDSGSQGPVGGYDLGSTNGRGQFATFDVVDTGHWIKVTGSGWKA